MVRTVITPASAPAQPPAECRTCSFADDVQAIARSIARDQSSKNKLPLLLLEPALSGWRQPAARAGDGCH